MLHVDISKKLSHSATQSFALEVSFQAKPGITILFGASGSGKSLTLQMVAGLQAPDHGRIELNGETYFDSERRLNVPIRRRKVGYVLQNLALFPHLTVSQNTVYGLSDLPRQERVRRSQSILRSLKIAELENRRPQTLSGGEQQRVALARALVTEPRILLLDEPLSALDLGVKRSILADLRQINQQMQIPILYVTHDRSEALSLGEHLLMLENGKIVAEGNPLGILERPPHESIAHLLDVENLFEGLVTRRYPERGTMGCNLKGCEVEVPYLDYPENQPLRFGVRSKDILVGIERPVGLSAQNVLPGRIVQLESSGYEMHLEVDCGVVFKVTTTRSAVETLQLHVSREVWLVFKAHSCLILNIR